MLQDFEPRLYQETILDTCIKHNTLVVLPTGLGKTAIGMMLIAHELEQSDEKAVFLAPTKPLAQQHVRTFRQHLAIPDQQLQLFTGDTKPERRGELWDDARVVFATPQGFENDVIAERVNLEDVAVMVFDEAHRATGKYSYVFIAEQYKSQRDRGRILGLTASPGSDKDTIRNVCDNLYIDDIELRTDEDSDVQPYIQDVDVQRIKVELPEEFAEVTRLLKTCYRNKLKKIKNFGYLSGKPSKYSRKELLQVQKGLQSKLADGDQDYKLMKSMSLLAEAMKLQHALILVETQGVEALVEYMRELQREADNAQTKAVQNLVQDNQFKAALAKADHLLEEGVTHPKIPQLKKLIAKTLNKNRDARIIVFNQFRDQVMKTKDVLDEMGVSSAIFVGQSKKKGLGMSQKEQKEVIEEFENGDFNCLLATSVAEEGLDIPSVDVVIFYEPIPSAIRTVQRRGRTGRQDTGKVYVLMAEDTIDEGYRWSAHHKEKNMIEAIKDLQDEFNPEYEEPELQEFDEQITVIADHREKGSGIIRELSRKDVSIEQDQLDVGDYVLSEEVCVEFKTVQDFADSVVDGRLLDQVKELAQYAKPVMIIEGEEDVYSQRKIHPNAVRGMILTITQQYDIPILWTKDPHESAAYIHLLARREQEDDESSFQFHSNKPRTLSERQEYVVASMPGIGNTIAKPLLEAFGSVRAIVNASVEELQQVELIGEKKAEQIRELLDAKYERG